MVGETASTSSSIEASVIGGNGTTSRTRASPTSRLPTRPARKLGLVVAEGVGEWSEHGPLQHGADALSRIRVGDRHPDEGLESFRDFGFLPQLEDTGEQCAGRDVAGRRYQEADRVVAHRELQCRGG